MIGASCKTLKSTRTTGPTRKEQPPEVDQRVEGHKAIPTIRGRFSWSVRLRHLLTSRRRSCLG